MISKFLPDADLDLQVSIGVIQVDIKKQPIIFILACKKVRFSIKKRLQLLISCCFQVFTIKSELLLIYYSNKLTEEVSPDFTDTFCSLPYMYDMLHT